jgi:hypothetical protein
LVGWAPWRRRDHLQFFPGDLRTPAVSQELRLLHLCSSPFDVMDQLESPLSALFRRRRPSGSFVRSQEIPHGALLRCQSRPRRGSLMASGSFPAGNNLRGPARQTTQGFVFGSFRAELHGPHSETPSTIGLVAVVALMVTGAAFSERSSQLERVGARAHNDPGRTNNKLAKTNGWLAVLVAVIIQIVFMHP